MPGTLVGARDETDIFGSCGDIITTPHLRDPHFWNTVFFRQLDHRPSLLIQHSTVFLYRQRAAAVPVHAYSLKRVLWVVRCRQGEELGRPLLSSRVGVAVNCALRHNGIADAWCCDQGALGRLILGDVVLGRGFSLLKPFQKSWSV